MPVSVRYNDGIKPVIRVGLVRALLLRWCRDGDRDQVSRLYEDGKAYKDKPKDAQGSLLYGLYSGTVKEWCAQPLLSRRVANPVEEGPDDLPAEDDCELVHYAMTCLVQCRGAAGDDIVSDLQFMQAAGVDLFVRCAGVKSELGYGGYSLVHYAVGQLDRNNGPQVLRFLLAAGLSPSQSQDVSIDEPPIISMFSNMSVGKAWAIPLLCDAGASPNVVTGGDPPLVFAVHDNLPEETAALLEYGANPNIRSWRQNDRDNECPLFMCGTLGTARLLLDAGANPYEEDSYRRGAIAIVATRPTPFGGAGSDAESAEFVKMLLSRGVSINHGVDDDAVKRDHPPQRALVAAGRFMRAHSPLACAIRYRRPGLVQHLLDLGATLDAKHTTMARHMCYIIDSNFSQGSEQAASQQVLGIINAWRSSMQRRAELLRDAVCVELAEVMPAELVNMCAQFVHMSEAERAFAHRFEDEPVAPAPTPVPPPQEPWGPLPEDFHVS